jgi:NAD(P)-dependent dehydrogenase (short-subunit alcohol dehydrogenase family)
VLITGATSGLGRYLAGQLAGSGWQVLALGRVSPRG